jgi:hypothetical protein
MKLLTAATYQGNAPHLALTVALGIATICLFLAVRLMKRAIEPIGALLQAILAATLAVIVIGAALAATAVAALTTW